MGRKKSGREQAPWGQGTAWQLPSGAWRCRCQVAGVRYTGRGTTERLARDDMRKKVAAATPDSANARGRTTIKQYAEGWRQGLELTARAPGTRMNYCGLLDKWLVPMIGTHRLASFSPEQRRGWWRAMRAGGASTSTVRNADVVLTAMLRTARDEDDYALHPKVLTLKRPQVDRVPQRRPSAAEMLRLLAHAKRADGTPDEPSLTVFWLLVATAARVAEVLGLHWGDVDELRGGVTIRVQLDKHTGLVRDTKTHQQRYVPLDREMLARLQQHRDRQRERDLPVGAGDPVFLHRPRPSKAPVVLSHGMLEEHFHKARRAAKLPDDLHIHSLRHGSAMLSIRAGTDLNTLRRKLGHAELSTTAQYVESDDALALGDAERVAAAMRDIGAVG